MTAERLQILHSLADVDATDWNKLAGDQPFLRHEFLGNLEQSGCVSKETGWEPQHLALWRDRELVAAMPLYLKHHSYGEYIFDWAWADAYHRSGLNYYPKLLSAIPFTPVTGLRLLAQEESLRKRLADAAVELAQELNASSAHILYPTESQATELASNHYLQRHSTQFHWRNHGYRDFDDFLNAMSHDKRKKIKQERCRVREAGVSFVHRVGAEITEEDWHFFFACYQRTYRTHHSPPYMNLEFFLNIAQHLRDQLLLVIGYLEGEPISVALNLLDGERLYGRYWGATQFVSGLHFETCYYQALEFAIAGGFQVFEGGAQGEHKLARGLLPVNTLSYHWLADTEFARAVGHFLTRETHGVAQYVDELKESSPFRAD